MAKKDNTKKALTSIPMSIAGLSGNLSDITKTVNSNNLETRRTAETTGDDKDGISYRGKGGGRPKKLDQEIVLAKGETEWDRFMDYTSQFYAKANPGQKVSINDDIKKFFESMKLVCGPKVDLRSMVNAALRLFVDNYKDEINERIKKQVIGE